MMNQYETFLKTTLPTLVAQVDAQTPAKWGMMSAQNMLEHLQWVFENSYGVREITPTADADRMAYRKMRFFEKDFPMPKNLKWDFLPTEAFPLRYETMEKAKDMLLETVTTFFQRFDDNRDRETLHPVLGNLSGWEWIRFHTRHCTHHFTQFGLLEEEILIQQ